MASVSAAAVIAGAGSRVMSRFNPAAFLHAAEMLCTNADGSPNGPLQEISYPGRRGLVNPVTRRYRPTAADADLAAARSAGIEPEDRHVLLNCPTFDVPGLPSADEIGAARAHAVCLSGGSKSYLTWRGSDEGDGEWAPESGAGSIGPLLVRCVIAGAEPVIVSDGVNGADWALWLFDHPVRISAAGRIAYREQNARLREVVGGIDTGDPLTTTLPMPGAEGVSYNRDGAEIRGGVTYFSGPGLRGEPVPRFGASLEAFDLVIDRIVATPRLSA